MLCPHSHSPRHLSCPKETGCLIFRFLPCSARHISSQQTQSPPGSTPHLVRLPASDCLSLQKNLHRTEEMLRVTIMWHLHDNHLYLPLVVCPPHLNYMQHNFIYRLNTETGDEAARWSGVPCMISSHSPPTLVSHAAGTLLRLLLGPFRLCPDVTSGFTVIHLQNLLVKAARYCSGLSWLPLYAALLFKGWH